MMHRLMLLIAGLAVLALAGCGTNSKTGLSEITLEPDLVAEDASTDFGTMELGKTNIVKVTVSNRGGVDARRFTVVVRVDWGGNSRLGFATLELGLGAGQAVAVEIPIQMPASGTNQAGSVMGQFTVFVDPDDDVRESDETNNVLVKPVLVTWGSTNTGNNFGFGTGIAN